MRRDVLGQGQWSVPGGHLEVGEEPSECAIRETREETGISIEEPGLVAITNDVFDEPKTHYVSLWYEAGKWKGRPRGNAEQETGEIGWFTVDRLPSPLFPPFARFIRAEERLLSAASLTLGTMVTPIDDSTKRDVLLEEYKTLRAESLLAIAQQNAVLRFGGAGLTVLLGLSSQLRDVFSLRVVLMVGVPLATWLILVIWLGEVERMVRAGVHIAAIERRINAALGTVLTWESRLREQKPRSPRVVGRYRAVVLLLLSLSALGVILGYALPSAPRDDLGYWLAASLAISAMTLLWYVLRERRLLALGSN